MSGEEEGDAEVDGQEEEVGAQPGVEEAEEEEWDGGELDGRAGEARPAGEEAWVKGISIFRFIASSELS